MNEFKKHIKKLKLQYLKNNHSEFYELSGGEKMKVKPYKDDTANGLTKCIEDFIKYTGGYCNRISTTGLMRKINGELKWTRGNSNKGAADIRILYKGMSIDVEVKIGRDKMSEAQLKEKKRIEDAGGYYIVASSFESFYEQFEKYKNLLEKV